MLAPWRAGSPQFTIKTLHMSDGLPSDRVGAVLQTRDGFLWAATFSGLARFDGVRFQTFPDIDTPTFRNSFINALFEDAQGRLWIGTDTGQVALHDAAGFHPVATPTNWPAGPVSGFMEAPQGTILVLFRTGYLGEIRDRAMAGVMGDGNRHYSDVAADRDGRVWAVRAGGAIVRLEDGKEVAGGNGPPREKGYCNIAASAQGGLWVRAGNQIKRWENGRWVEDRGAQSWKTTRAVKMRETDHGDLLIGTSDEGLFVVSNDGATEHLNRENGLASDMVGCFCEDFEHDLWVGTDRGLALLRTPLVSTLKPEDDWGHAALNTVFPARRGGLWIGTGGAGLYYYGGESFRRFYDTNGGLNQDIRSVIEDRHGRLLVGTQGGLFTLQDETMSQVPGAVETGGRIYALYEAHDGTLWIGTQNGVAIGRHGQWSRLGTNLYRPDVRCIAETTNGDIWLGMRGGGLARYAKGRFTQFRQAPGLPDKYIWSMLADADGSLWIGTFGGGLTRGRNGKFSNFTFKQGLPSDFICGIQGDDMGNLWIASYGGIFRVAKSDLARCEHGEIAAVSPFVLGVSDGLETLEMSGGHDPCGCRLADGRFCFPTVGGLAVVNPATMRLNRLPPPVWIEEALVDHERATGTDASRLVIPPGKTQLEIHYTALSFSSPEQVRFKIRMNDIDQDWVDVGAQRSAYYAHLRPGQYEFHVMACNNHGVWNEAGATTSIKVQPFFWQTWWFMPLCWLGSAVLIAAVVTALSRQRHQRKMESLERARMVEHERRRIAQDLHDDVGAVLTEIESTSTLAQATAGNSPETQEYLQEISSRSRQLIASMDEIVWAVNPKNDNLGSVTSYFCNYAEKFLGATPMRRRFEVPEDVPELPFNAEQRHSLFLAFKEALHNAARHSGGSEVWTTFAFGGGELRIEVTDNGGGMADHAHPHGADGLNNMRARLEQLGGRCEISAPMGGGTRVAFIVPVAPRKNV
jgi:ligand-binding sensor domain-containing protein/signal transduction histidine kinase